jgi:glycosyl transferase, family 25
MSEGSASRQRVPVFVISLQRAAERRELISRHLQELGVEHRIVDAVDGKAMPEADRARLLAPGQSYHAGVVGCYLSHLAVYQAVVDEDIEVALVLEDDARLSRHTASLLKAGCRNVDFDYCFLDSDDHNDRGPVFYDRGSAVELAPGIRAYQLNEGPQTLHAYLISREGARKRLGQALPIVKPIDLYDHLPYAITFRHIVSPKLAWVSEHSLTSFTSDRNDDPAALSFGVLRRSPWFYRLRDLVRFKAWRGRREVARRVQQGLLPPGRQWAALPSGREVVMQPGPGGPG